MAPAGGVRGQAGRAAPVAGAGVPVPGSGPGGRCGPGERAGRCRDWWCGRLAWIIVGTGPSRACLLPRAG